MAIPVLFTVELFPWGALEGTKFEAAVLEFNNELREFFADKVDLHEIPRDTSNLTETQAVHGTGTDGIPFAAATVVVGFRNVSLDQARALAAEFDTKVFNHASAEVLDPEQVLNSEKEPAAAAESAT